MTARPFILRLLAPFTLMIALVVTLSASAIYIAGERAARIYHLRDLERLLGVLRQDLGRDGVIAAEDLERLRQAGDLLKARIALIDAAGEALMDTGVGASAMPNQNDNPEVRQARAQGAGVAVRRGAASSDRVLHVAGRVRPDQGDGPILRLSYPMGMWSSLSTPTWLIAGSSVAGAALLMVGLGLLLNRQWVGPVRGLSQAAARMAQGDWSARVEPRGAEELRAFSRRLNTLARAAERQVSDLNDRRADLQALVDALPDPILLTDADGRLLLLNDPAARLTALRPQQAAGKNVVQAITDEAIVELFEPGRRPDASEPIRLLRAGQRITLQPVVKPMQQGGLLVVLRDVTALSDVVQMKSDFVANASHELRTPIAAIRIAFETLGEVYEEDAEQARRCMGIIGGHLRRLEDMLSDLLDLSRVEAADLHPHLVPVDLAEMLTPISATLGPVARQKGVTLSVDGGNGSGPPFESDRRLLNLILKNLVENAIKFTPSGGRVEVRAALLDGGDSLELCVADTGIGIPKEHQERVFERFYQVEAARSGSAGRGTGLGLAIVKHAALALGGRIRLQSDAGKGTTVLCTFPRIQTATEVDAA